MKHSEATKTVGIFSDSFGYVPIWRKNRGPVHHYNKHGNEIVFERIVANL